ncbi:GntR family transcriptional regulator [Mesorhizobium sp. 1B3]|uniref:GntR family transcriptional regulator n=1 Tax=Mesorhizobium sp. 1B3 TaxID=3243599 RepID=UPI003D982A61
MDDESEFAEPTGSLSRQAYNIVERMMIQGEIPPGALLSEVLLSQMIGIGRTPVREALQRLARDRLVTIVPRRGAVVSRLGPEEYLDTLPIRREVEREIVTIMAKVACRQHRHSLLGLAKEMREAVDEGSIYKAIEIDRRFKLIEAAACNNTLLLSAIRPLHALSRRFYFAQARKPLPQVALAQARLMEHIAQGDEGAARDTHDAFVNAIESFAHRLRQRAKTMGGPKVDQKRAAHIFHSDGSSLSSQAFQVIEHRIITRQYTENELLTEGRLGEELGLGRTPIREALQKLASHHLVTIIPRKGVHVTDFESLDLETLVQARRPLEALLCRRAAERANAMQRRGLHSVMEPWLEAANRNDNATIMRLDLEMKSLLIEAAGSIYLADAITPIHTLARALYFRHQTTSDLDVAHAQVEVLQAIIDGNPLEAGLGALRFIAESAHAIRKSLRCIYK